MLCCHEGLVLRLTEKVFAMFSCRLAFQAIHHNEISFVILITHAHGLQYEECDHASDVAAQDPDEPNNVGNSR